MATSNLRFRIIGDDDASGAFLKVAAAARLTKGTFDDLGTSALGITKLIGGAGLVPVAAGATAALANLTTSATAGAGALGIFGISVVGIGADMVKQQKAIAALQTHLGTLTKGTQDYRDQLDKIHTAQQAFNQQFGPAAKGLADVKNAFTQFKQATQGVTVDVMAKGFALISSVLPRLVPVSNAAGRAVGGLIDDLTSWTKSPAFAGLLHWFETSGPKAITHFGHAVGNIFVGLGGIMSNFVGPGDKAAASLERLTKRFSAWGRSKGVSDSVNRFLDYVASNGPQITSVLRSLGEALPKVASSLGGLGSVNLRAISLFLNMIAGMPQGVFDVVVNGLFGIAVATKAVAAVTAINALLTGLQIGLTAVGDAAIGTRIGLALLAVQEKALAAASAVMTAAQWALNIAMDANPIGLVVIAIAALVAGLIIAYKKSATFRAIVQGAFHGVQAAASASFNWIKGHWKLLAAILGGPIIAAAIVIASHWARIKAGAQATVGAIRSAFSKVAGVIGGAFHAAVSIVSGAWDRMRSFVTGYIKFMTSLPGKILSAVGDLGGLLVGAGRAVIQGLIDGVESMVRPLTSKLHSITSLIPLHKGPIGKDRLLLRPSGEAIMEGLIHGIESKKVAMTRVLDALTNRVKATNDKLKAAIATRNSFASGFQNFSTSVFGASFGQDAQGNEVAPTTSGILAFQQQQADQAAALARNVKALTRKGLSASLLKQLQGAGQSGIAEINALASASPAEIRRLNALNAQTSGSLQSAGMSAGNAIYGHQIAQDRRDARQSRRLLEEIRDAIKGENAKNLTITDANGDWIIRAVRKEKRKKGEKSAL